jgi:hypothetical protein
MVFGTLSDEQLINVYLKAHRQKLDDSFLKLLLDEIIRRDIYDLLLETSLRN